MSTKIDTITEKGNAAASIERRKNVKAAGYKILTYDVETAPNLVYAFQLFNQNISIGQIVKPSRILSFAARKYGEKKVHYYDEFTGTHQDMIEALWKLMDETDAVVTYNGKSFDDKITQGEFMLAGLPKPSPFVDIDLLQAIRSTQKHPSHKLDYIGQSTGIGAKVAHEGFGLWKSCMEGDTKAWARMKKYNIGDVVLTEDLYDFLAGRIHNHPTFNGGPYNLTCNQCGSSRLEPSGVHRAGKRQYDRYSCDVCHAWVAGTQVIKKMSAAKGIR